MPQTREHLAIIDLLGIERGVVVLTKRDLVDAEALHTIHGDVAEVIAGTTMEAAPVVECSALTGDGLSELMAAIEAQLTGLQRRRAGERARLPIDRVFTMPGFGTVVTGTLLDGKLSVGQEVEIVPGGLIARVRGLQNHGASVEVAQPGSRTAVNLSGVAVDELHRGMVVAEPGALHATTAVDVRLRVVGYLGREVKHNLRVTFHTGAAEAAGRLVLLDAEELRAGESAWAQVRLDEALAALPGDRFIVRDANDTLGGGRIIAVDAERHRRHHGPTIAHLAALETGESPQTVAGPTTTVRNLLVQLEEHHRRWRLRRGMPREELRSRLGMDKTAFEGLLRELSDGGSVVDAGVVVALPGREPVLTSEERAVADDYLAALRAQPFSPPVDGRPDDGLLGYLIHAGEVVVVGDIVFDAAAYADATERVRKHLAERGTITLAQARDLLGTSRKYAQALLEHLDARHITRRMGDERVLR
jgi:selenocysteine-specific elongation factor